MKLNALKCSLLLAVLFPLFAGSCTGSCAVNSNSIDADAEYIPFRDEFYQALLLKSDPEKKAEAVQLFKDSLACSNEFIRAAAAEELANFMFQASLNEEENQEITFTENEISKIRREASGVWASAFEAAESKDKEKALSFFFSFSQGEIFPNEARLYVLSEFEKLGILFSDTELAAIHAHYAAIRAGYSEALSIFRALQQETRWPANIPGIFLDYPVLIVSLGRSFQYTSSGGEGLDLFINWERNPSVRAARDNPARYYLTYYAARIARRMRRNEQAASLFENALPLAYNGEQSDACIWYIMEAASAVSPDVFLERLERNVPLLHRKTYIDDLLERFAHRLVTDNDWTKLIRTYDIIKDSSNVSKARYAWIISLTIEAGLLSSSERLLASSASGVTPITHSVFKEIAYNTGNNIGTSALYYRYVSAAYLNKPFLELEDYPAPSEKTQAVQFLLGFFDNDASHLANPYIRAMERDLSPDEMRITAEALFDAEMYNQTIRLVTQYLFREGYSPNRRDLELFYPNPYKDIIETNAVRFGFAPSLLFGLIRTESAFQSAVVSHANAVGLSQLIPATAREVAGWIRNRGGFPQEIAEFTPSDAELDLNNPALNVYIGTYYLNYLMGRFDNDIMHSLMAYNGGMNRVRRWNNANTLPAGLFVESVPIYETRDYGKRVLAVAAAYEDLYYR